MVTMDELKLEIVADSCCVCGNVSDLQSPEEYDTEAPPGQTPLRMMLLHLNNNKVVPEGRLCSSCIQRTLEAYEFSTALSSSGVPPLSEKIRSLRRKLHELTQKIDVFIVVGGSNLASGGCYNEEDIIMVDKAALAAAAKADDEELERARNARGDTVYQCTVCPASFQRVSEYRTHVESHGRAASHACWTCGAQFATRTALHDHLASHADTTDNTCYVCGTTFQRQSELRRHEAACACRCPSCGAELADRAALSAHAAAAHGVTSRGRPLCPCCFRSFPDGELLAAHLLRHRQAKQFVCGYDSCILRFAARSSLLAHVRKCHGAELPAEPAPPRPPGAACRHCSRTFGSVAAMKRHARVHRDDRASPDLKDELGAESQEEGDEGEVEYLEVETLEDGEVDESVQ